MPFHIPANITQNRATRKLDFCQNTIIHGGMTQKIQITRPDDFHLHLRDDAIMRAVLPETTRHFARALIMPNLNPPVVTAQNARDYRARIIAAMPPDADFTPLMTLYLTEQTDPNDLAIAVDMAGVIAVKYYPMGATTHSDFGVKTLQNVMPVLERMADMGLNLCIHGEVTDPDIDIFDREAVFIDRVLLPLHETLPELKITAEHITTKTAVEAVLGAGANLSASITVHHLMINRTHLLAGGIRPHYYCLPVAKREIHRVALRGAAISGNPKFFLGTDSAPHMDTDKLSACGCAGCFTAPHALPLLAQVFDEENALPALNGFCAEYGAAHYGLPQNTGTITLEKGNDPQATPAQITPDNNTITAFNPPEPFYWFVR